jgi:phospholipid-binding lipoprotein MlaA
MLKPSFRSLLAVLALLWLSGCASIVGRDPFEAVNRKVFAFNDQLDHKIVKPIAQGYQDKVPAPVRSCVGNFFYNLSVPVTAANDLLQLKVQAACEDVMRFAVNTVFGLGGCLDPASEMGLQRNKEDLGQTLGHYGVQGGPYLVIPFLGPTTARDLLASTLDNFTVDPTSRIRRTDEYLAVVALNGIDVRARYLRAEALLDDMGVDKYAVVRDVFLQKRRSAIYDGNPPDEDEPEKPAKPSKQSQLWLIEPQRASLSPSQSLADAELAQSSDRPPQALTH